MNTPSIPPAPGGSAATARRTLIVLFVATAFGLALLFVYDIRQVLVWLLIACLLAVALDPAVRWLIRHRWRRTPAVPAGMSGCGVPNVGIFGRTLWETKR